jgi:hypothetical protein
LLSGKKKTRVNGVALLALLLMSGMFFAATVPRTLNLLAEDDPGDDAVVAYALPAATAARPCRTNKIHPVIVVLTKRFPEIVVGLTPHPCSSRKAGRSLLTLIHLSRN